MARVEQPRSAAKRVAGLVRREVEVQVRRAIAEHVDVNLVAPGRVPKRAVTRAKTSPSVAASGPSRSVR